MQASMPVSLHNSARERVPGVFIAANCANLSYVSDVCLTEAVYPKGGRVGERRFAHHHFRQQPSGHGAERQAVVVVSEREPQATVTGRGADDRAHIGRTGAHAVPRLCVDALAESERGARKGLGSSKLNGGRGRSVAGDFDTRRQT